MKKLAVFAGLLLASCTAQQKASAPVLASAPPQVESDKCGALAHAAFGRDIAITEAVELPAAAPGTVPNGPGGPLASGLPAYCSV